MESAATLHIIVHNFCWSYRWCRNWRTYLISKGLFGL